MFDTLADFGGIKRERGTTRACWKFQGKIIVWDQQRVGSPNRQLRDVESVESTACWEFDIQVRAQHQGRVSSSKRQSRVCIKSKSMLQN